MNAKAIIVFIILAVLAAGLYLLSTFGGEELFKKTPALSRVSVAGFVGGEKMNLLANPEIIELLRTRHGLTVDAKKAGSIAMCTTLPTDGIDFLWPSSQVAAEMFRNGGGQAKGEEIIFKSPMVLYTWAPISDALQARGVVRQAHGNSFIVEFDRLIQLLREQTTWADIGLSELYGRIAIFSTDPTQSNSGNMFAGLLANMLGGGKVVTVQTVQPILAEMKTMFENLGYMPHSSGDIFQAFLNTGMGGRPIIVGYESQAIEFVIANLQYRDFINQKIRILYPVPTVWSSHPVIALTDNGRRFMDALKDPDIQRLAWEKHGFRSGLLGVANDPGVLTLTGVAEDVTSVISMPDAATMTAIVDHLSQ